MGSDRMSPTQTRCGSVFQSTLPGWGATFTPVCAGICLIISIHAPRMGSDIMLALIRHYEQFQSTLPGWGATRKRCMVRHAGRHFNPRSPDGERPGSLSTTGNGFAFQSTLPGWGATGPLTSPASSNPDFNPRSPDGERRNHGNTRFYGYDISIHAPRMGSDLRRQ